MWIMLSDAMFSLVEDRNDPTSLVVRARRKGDLEKVFVKYKDAVIENAGSDYRFRIFADRSYVSEIVASEVDRISYPNFKNSVRDVELHNAYTKIWTVMYHLRDENYPTPWIYEYYAHKTL